MALPAFSFLFRNGKQSKAQRAAAGPLPFGLLFRLHTGAAGAFLSTEAPTSSALDGGGLDGTMNNTPLNMYGYNTTIHHGRQNIEVKKYV